jgi:spore coat protein CotH
MVDVAASCLPQSGEILYNQEEFSSNNCFKCMYLEERLKVTLSELSSIQLAINLLYNEINETHTESEVISNSIAMKDDHVGVKLPSNWYTIKSNLTEPVTN